MRLDAEERSSSLTYPAASYLPPNNKIPPPWPSIKSGGITRQWANHSAPPMRGGRSIGSKQAGRQLKSSLRNPADRSARTLASCCCWAANKVHTLLHWVAPSNSSQLDEVFGAQRWDFWWLCFCHVDQRADECRIFSEGRTHPQQNLLHSAPTRT